MEKLNILIRRAAKRWAEKRQAEKRETAAEEQSTTTVQSDPSTVPQQAEQPQETEKTAKTEKPEKTKEPEKAEKKENTEKQEKPENKPQVTADAPLHENATAKMQTGKKNTGQPHGYPASIKTTNKQDSYLPTKRQKKEALYLINKSSRYLGNVHIRSSTINSSLSMW